MTSATGRRPARSGAELLEFPPADAQQLVVLLPANDPTSAALSKLFSGGRLALVK